MSTVQIRISTDRAAQLKAIATKRGLDTIADLLDAFIDDTQKYVSGDIRLKLQGGRAVVTGRKSEQSLYDFSLATYDTGDTFDQSLSKGFIEIWSLPSKISAQRDLAQ